MGWMQPQPGQTTQPGQPTTASWNSWGPLSSMFKNVSATVNKTANPGTNNPAGGGNMASTMANGISPHGPGTSPGAMAAANTPAAVPDYGSASGPGYLEQRYLSRLNGDDLSYNYALKRGMDAVDSRMAAGGSYNSGARGQQLSDLSANLAAQSQSQLDALAGGASGERQGALNSMFGQAFGIAGGQSGLASTYDTGAGNALSAGNEAALMMALQKAGVDQKAAQGLINNIFGAAAVGAMVL